MSGRYGVRFHAGIAVTAMLLAGTPALSQSPDEMHLYRVTITNLTKGQTFTPILIVSHRKRFSVFTLGAPASDELVQLAEDGLTRPFQDLLNGHPDVGDVVTTSGLAPGDSRSATITAGGKTKRLSMEAMLIPTNDGFFAVQGVKIPKDDKAIAVTAVAYDAGSEPNDELCASIPGSICGGRGLSPDVDGEGFVHVHAGIHGIGDLEPSERDWRNPVALIEIRRAE